MKIAGLLICLTLCSGFGAPTNDWPVYRHDVALSGVSPAKGRIVTPEVKWEYYLGAPFVGIAANKADEPGNTADLDGDGTTEKFSLSGKTIEVTDRSGKRLWSFTGNARDRIASNCSLPADR